MRKYFYIKNGEKIGPLSEIELLKEPIKSDTKIWYFGLKDWTEFSNIYDLNNSRPPIPINTNNNTFSNPRKWLFSILGLTLIIVSLYFYLIGNKEEKIYNEVVANSISAEEDSSFYLDNFYRDLEFYGIYPQKPKEIIIKLSNIDQIGQTSHIHALCYGINNDEIIEIYINKNSWNSFNKPLRYLLMYHELSHDVLNLEDLEATPNNEGKLMYSEISRYENYTMDDFIESFHLEFENYNKN